MKSCDQILVLIGLTGLSVALTAGEVPQRYYNPETVMIQSQVNIIAQDSRGFIWVGTMGGINVFTGVSVYAITSADGLENEWIRFLGEVTPDTMWIGTKAGLGYYVLHGADSVRFFPKTKPYEIRRVAQFQQQMYVITTYMGLFTLHGDSLTPVAEAIFPEGTLLMDIAEWQGVLWFATSNGLYRWDGKTVTADGPDKFFLRMAVSDEGLWCAGSSGLFLKGLNRDEWVIPDEVVLDVDVVGDEVAAALFYVGVKRFNRHEPEVQRLITSNNGLPKTSFRSVFFDRQGSLWVGTDGEGLALLYPYDFQTFTAISGLSNPMVSKICRFGDSLLVATDAGVFYSTDDEKFNFLHESEAKRTWCVMPFGSNQILVGYDDATILYGRGTDGQLIEENQLWDFASYDVLAVGDSIWVATDKGLRLYHPDGHWQVFTDEDGFSSTLCQSLAVSKEGIYVGTDRGLNYFHEGLVEVWEDKSVIWDVVVDQEKKIWVGTESGLIVLNPDGTREAWYNQASGLPGTIVYSVDIAETDGSVWIGTNRGIAQLQKDQLKLLGYEDGLPANEMNGQAIFTDQTGVWFGCIKGLIHIPPKFQFVEHVPSVQPYQFWQDEHPVGQWDSNFPHLHPALTVDLGAPDFLNSGIEFRYRFIDQPGEWISLGTNTQLSLTNLTPAKYEIALQAHGVRRPNWGPTHILPPFVVEQPFYQRWEFLSGIFILSIFLFSGITYFTLHYRHERETMRRQHEEIVLAHEFNQQLAETSLPEINPDWKISVDFQPYNEFSGDFYFAFQGRGERFCVLVGDVAGSGLETSYLNGFIKMSLQSQDWNTMTMSTWLVQMNQALYRLPRSGLFVALTTAVVDRATGETYCLSAGNPAPFMVNASGQPEMVETNILAPIGVFADWEPQWQRIVLEPDSILGLHSDGIRLNPAAPKSLEPLRSSDLLALNASQLLRTLSGSKWILEELDDRLLITVNHLESIQV